VGRHETELSKGKEKGGHSCEGMANSTLPGQENGITTKRGIAI